MRVGSGEERSPALTSLQLSYVEASRAGAQEITRKQLRGFYWAAFAYSMAQIVVIYFWNFDAMSETAMVKMSWVWLPGLTFALAGLTIARYRMRRAFMAMFVAMVLFAGFYAAIWPML